MGLYIKNARKDISAKELSEQPLPGSLFVCTNSGHKGMPAFEYKK